MKPQTELERKALELDAALNYDIYQKGDINDYYSEMEMNIVDSAYEDISYNCYDMNAKGMIYHSIGMMHVVQRVKDWTVVRTLLLDFSMRVPFTLRDLKVSDVVHQWIAPSGERVTLAKHKGRTRNCCGDWDYWNHDSKMEVRRNFGNKYDYLYWHNEYANTYNLLVHDFAPGFMKCDMGNIDDRLTRICSRTNILLYNHYRKMWNKYKADDEMLNSIDRFSRQIFLASRNHYDWTEDCVQWFDMLEMIEYCNGNLEDVRVICPANLKAAHDIWMERSRIRRETRERQAAYDREVQRKQEEADRKRWKENADEEYRMRKEKYLVIAFGNDDYDFRVIQNIDEFKTIGNAHGQCIYSCGYYKHNNQVLMTCTEHKTGKYVSTITVDINNFRVSINLGHGNSKVTDEERINRIVAENMQLFRDAKRAMQQCQEERDKQLAESLEQMNAAPIIPMAI